MTTTTDVQIKLPTTETIPMGYDRNAKRLWVGAERWRRREKKESEIH